MLRRCRHGKETRHGSPALFVLLLAATAAPAQSPAPAWRVLREMEVAGAAAFDRDQIAAALVADGDVMRALQRTLDAETAAVVAARAAAVHRSGGYAQAKVTGAVHDGRLHLAIDAGARLRCGGLVCRGNTVVATAVLRERFADAAEGKPLWREGDFPAMDESAKQRVLRRLDQVYRGVGRYGVDAAIEHVAQDERMVLDVTVHGEGREVHVQRLVLAGEDATQQAAVLAALPFTPGTAATTAVLDDLRRWLEATGRYVAVTVEVPADPPASLDPLTVTVQLRPEAPAFAAVPLRDVRQLQAALERCAGQLRGGGAMRIETALAETLRWGRGEIQPGAVTVALARNGVLLTAERLQWNDGPVGPATLWLGNGEVAFRAGAHAVRWTSPWGLGLQAQLLTGMLPSGEMDWRWGVGIAARSGDGVEIQLHAATAARLLARVDTVHRDGDVLVLEYGGRTVRIGADGALAGGSFGFSRDGQEFAIDFPAALEPPAGATTAGGDAGQLLLELAHGVLAAGFAKQAPGDVQVQALLQGLAEAAAATAALPRTEAPSTRQEAPFGFQTAGTLPQRIGSLVLVPAVDRRWQGRIVDLAAAFGSMLRGDVSAANASFRGMVQDDTVGPLTMAIAAAVHDVLGNERQVRAFRTMAASRATFAAVWSDGAALAASFPSLQALPARVGAAWRARPELRELLVGLPAGAEGDVAAWRRGLEHLWQAGGQQLLREALRLP